LLVKSTLTLHSLLKYSPPLSSVVNKTLKVKMLVNIEWMLFYARSWMNVDTFIILGMTDNCLPYWSQGENFQNFFFPAKVHCTISFCSSKCINTPRESYFKHFKVFRCLQLTNDKWLYFLLNGLDF
jgi:hypothetical protein